MVILLGIPKRCFTYDEAQKASRDPARRDKLEEHLKIIGQTRAEIEDRVDHVMARIENVMDVSDELAELTYFNTWFNRRGGWSG